MQKTAWHISVQKMYKIRPIPENQPKISQKHLVFLGKALDKSVYLTYTMFRKAKDLVLLEVPAFGPFNRYIVWVGKPAKESAPEQIGEGRVYALADPARGGAIRFKVLRLVCGHPPKSGSGHGRRMRRPLRFRCAAAPPILPQWAAVRDGATQQAWPAGQRAL